MTNAPHDLENQAAVALEAARLEVVRRMVKLGLPLALTVVRPTILPHETGWSSGTETIQVSGLANFDVLFAIRDDSVPSSVIGLREELEPLAKLLDSTTNLGVPRSSGMYPGLAGAEGVLMRCVIPLALAYLRGLRELSVPDDSLVQRLVGELTALSRATRTVHVRQLAINGVLPNVELNYRGVRIRPLTHLEQGAASQANLDEIGTSDILQSDFVVPSSFSQFIPCALLETRTLRLPSENEDTSTLLRAVVLSFFLHDFELTSSGAIVNYDEPQWLAQGYMHQPFEVSGKFSLLDRDLTESDFRSVVDLAHRMPPFTAGETSRREIVLDRVLRGCGAEHAGAGFLDFVIALEGALLGGVKLELAYKFSLYGAIFLRQEHDPRETFARLRNIYQVRSGLVHGSPPRSEARADAFTHAGKLARAVVRRSIEAGWPDGKHLDQVAIDGLRDRQ